MSQTLCSNTLLACNSASLSGAFGAFFHIFPTIKKVYSRVSMSANDFVPREIPQTTVIKQYDVQFRLRLYMLIKISLYFLVRNELILPEGALFSSVADELRGSFLVSHLF